MASFAPAVKHAPNSLAEVFDAAWVVVGRRSYTLNHDEVDQLRLDLALCIGRMAANDVTDTRNRSRSREVILRAVVGGARLNSRNQGLPLIDLPALAASCGRSSFVR